MEGLSGRKVRKAAKVQGRRPAYQEGQEVLFCVDGASAFVVPLQHLVNHYVLGRVRQVGETGKKPLVVERLDGVRRQWSYDPETYEVLSLEEANDPGLLVSDEVLSEALRRWRKMGEAPLPLRCYGKGPMGFNAEALAKMTIRQMERAEKFLVNDPLVVFIPTRDMLTRKDILSRRAGTFMVGYVAGLEEDGRLKVRTHEPCTCDKADHNAVPIVPDCERLFCIGRATYEKMREDTSLIEAWLEGMRGPEGHGLRLDLREYARLLRESFGYIPKVSYGC